MNARPTTVLLVEDDSEEYLLIAEALLEIQENPNWQSCFRCFDATHVESASEAVSLLEAQKFDLILLDVSAAGDPGLHPFFDIRSAAGGVPIVILACPRDEALAVSAVREGAQDYLLRSEIECARLARCMRRAMEAQRLCQSLRSVSFLDDLTGLYNERAFFAFAAHDLQLARRLGKSLCLVLAQLQVSGARPEREDRTLLWIEAAERLRGNVHPEAITGRLGDDVFAAVVVDGAAAELLRIWGGAKRQPGRRASRSGKNRIAATFRFGYAVSKPGDNLSLEDLFAEARDSLCENGSSGRESLKKEVLSIG